ncbi:MAG TPA: MBL fold metallo-hydrolase [Jatrophihabitans sp.]|nr:MBL fold metallo-hydrolase [Jatrophihabitans sp.]
MHVEVITTAELGDRSYLVTSGRDALVVDPQRDIDRVERLLTGRGLRLSLVLETHIHNDYVTGGYELARRWHAQYAVNAADPVAFERLAVADGDELQAGSLRVRVLATPGHTDTHLAYLVTDLDAPGAPPAVFTGGSLLYGSVGRTDLVDTARTDELTRAQFRSARRLAELLPDSAPVFPTHGFGSFCSSGSAAGGEESTIGQERRRNDALTEPDEQAFVERLVANLTAYPAYYAHMAPLNRQGPAVPELLAPVAVDGLELGKRLAAGEWVVDLRDRIAYARDHLRGSVSIELGEQFSTYLGWLAPWDAPITLIAGSAEDVTEAQRQLMRIGIDGLAGAATGDLGSLTTSATERAGYRVAGFAELAEREPGEVVLDVRRADERAASRLPGSLGIPLHSLLARLAELPDARLWVHCASGFRSAIAASLLDRAGFDVVYVDDDFDTAVELGLVTG